MALFEVQKSELDNTVKIFDSFYSNQLKVNSNQYDIVRGYFIGVCKTKNVADNFTAVLFRIAQEADIDALELLENVKGTSNIIQINRILAYYLNSFKSKTSLYGISSIPRSIQPVARNVVQ
jgi:hypothetical protein